MGKRGRIRKLLVANRSEIAIRVLRAANELGIKTVAIFSHEDRYALHRFKADEAYLVGRGKKPIEAYLDIDGILRIARDARVDAVHPGYGFLSENPDFAAACAAAGLTFVGPPPEVMRRLGSKLEARALAEAAGLAVMPATGPLPHGEAAMRRLAAEVGFPLMAKASWGGGGRGIRIVAGEEDLATQVAEGRREAKAAFGNDEIFLEKLVRRARHVEVQLIGDAAGEVVHLFERDCSLQRRNQKVVERAPAPYLDEAQRRALCEGAVRLARAAGYRSAGTAEFLMDCDTGVFYFIEVNPRIQVEHTVSEAITGIDVVKAQIHIAEGAGIGEAASGVPTQAEIRPLRPRPPVPDHHRGSAEPVHPGLRADHRLPRRQRLRHPARRRHRLLRRGDHPLLRLPARKGHRLGTERGRGHRAHGPRPARIPDPRRGHQPALPRSADPAPGLPPGRGHPPPSSTGPRRSSTSSRAATARPVCSASWATC